MKTINLKFVTVLCLLLFVIQCTFAQYVCSEKVYSILPGETIVFEDEHRLLNGLDETNHLILTQKDSLNYIVFNGKRYGPFDYLEAYESNRSLLDWGVMNSGKWYQVILDKDLILGPYDEVSDVFRDNKNKHYGLRAMLDSLWYVIIDGNKFGPYKDVSQFYPTFSPNGDNWMIEAIPFGQENSRLITKYGDVPVSSESDNYEVFLNESGFDFFHKKYTYYFDGWGYSFYEYSGYPYYTYSYDASSKTGIDYHMRGDFKYKSKEDRYNDSIVLANSVVRMDDLSGSGFKFDDAHKVKIFKTGLMHVDDNFGNSFGPFNNCFDFQTKGKFNLYAAENYFVKEKNSWVPVYRNVNINEKKDFYQLPKIELSKESFLIVNDKKYGPFEHIEKYSIYLSDNGHYAAIVNKDRELFLDGSLTNIKHVAHVSLDDKTGNCFSVDDKGEYWLNKTKLGRIGIETTWYSLNMTYSDDGNHYAYIYKESDGYYIYNSFTNKKYGPYNMLLESIDWTMSSDGKHIAVATSDGIFIDGNQVAPSGCFSVVYSEKEQCFFWLNLKGRDIFKEKYSFYNLIN